MVLLCVVVVVVVIVVVVVVAVIFYFFKVKFANCGRSKYTIETIPILFDL